MKKAIVSGRGRNAGSKEENHLTSAKGVIRITSRRIIVKDNDGIVVFQKEGATIQEEE